MPEEVFKWMAHSVNQDFVSMGYPAILTKAGDHEFVNLCPFIRNCSLLLTLFKAQKRTLKDDSHNSTEVRTASIVNVCGVSSVDSRSSATMADCNETAAATAASAAAEIAAAASGPSSPGQRKRRRWGLFSSKLHRRTGSGRQQQKKQQQQQQQHQMQQLQQTSSSASLHKNMVRKMCKDTERIIRRTACFSPAENAAAPAPCPTSPYAEGTQDHQDFMFMHTTWRNFRKLAQSRIVECLEAQRRVDDLQREISALSTQLERTRSAVAVPQAEDTMNLPMMTTGGCGSSTGGSVGRLQRVGGFLRRAISKEGLTFGRRPKLCESDEAASSSGVGSCGMLKRSRSCSISVGIPTPAPAASDTEIDLRRMFERRERLLLSEREKLRQANSKLNFRVQHLSGLVAAAKQNISNGTGGAGGTGGIGSGSGGSSTKDADYMYRRLERRVAALQKEVSALKQELNERIDSLSGIGATLTKFSREATAAAAAVPDGTGEQLNSLTHEPPADSARVPQLVDSICRATLAKIHRLSQSLLAAQAKAASAGDCLQLVQRRLGLTQGAMENTRAMEVELDAIATRLASKSTPVLERSLSVTSSHRYPSADIKRVSTLKGAPATAPPPQPPPQAALALGDAKTGDDQRLELRDRIIDKLTTMLRERQEEVRRLKEFSLSCQDVSSIGGPTFSAAGEGNAAGLPQLQLERKSRLGREPRSNVFR